MKYLYFFLCLIIATTAFGGDNIPKIDSLIAHSIENKMFSGSVLVTKNKKVIYQKTYGLANAENSVVIDPKTSFNLSSLTRTLTTSCVLKLVEEGKLNLNDNMKKFIPEYPFEGVTIRNFLRQNSGRDENEAEKCNNSIVSECSDKNSTFANNDQLLDNKYDLSDYKDERREKYLNENYKLLTTLVEKVSGQSFKNYVHTNIFSPCQMGNSFINNEDDFANKAVPYKYSYLSEKFSPFQNGYNNNYDAGIYSNCEDLLNFTENYFSGNIISKELVEEATASDNLTKASKYIFGGFALILCGLCLIRRTGNKLLLTLSAVSMMTGTLMTWTGFYNKRHELQDYAMGWEKMIYNKEEVTYQTGNVGGAKNILWHEQSGLNIIILSNSTTCPNYELAKNISNIVHEQPHHLPDLSLASIYCKNLKNSENIEETIRKTTEEWKSQGNEFLKYEEEENEKIQELGFELLSLNKVPESLAAFNLNKLLKDLSWTPANTYSDVLNNSGKTINSLRILSGDPEDKIENERSTKLNHAKDN